MEALATRNTQKYSHSTTIPSKCCEIILLKFPSNQLDKEKIRLQDKQNMMLVSWENSQICSTLPNKLHELGITELPSTAVSFN